MARVRGNPLLRLIDRFVGIPLVALIGLRGKRRMVDRAGIRRIGLLRISAIGDTLLMSAVIEAVNDGYPAADVVLITGEDNASVGSLLPGRFRQLTVPAARPLAAVKAIRAADLDLLIDFGPWPRLDALLSALSGASYTVGFRTHAQYRHFAYDQSVEHLASVHEVVNYRSLVTAIGVHATVAPHVRAPGVLPAERRPAAPYVVLHAWPGGFLSVHREWASDRWIELSVRLAKRGWTIVLSGARSDSPRSAQLADAIASAGPRVIDAAGKYTIAELADLLSGSEAVVSVNTGVMHLAALLGVATVGLNGPTPSTRWGPVGPRVRAVETTLERCGYLNLGFEYDGERLDCMQGISVDAVEAAIDALLA